MTATLTIIPCSYSPRVSNLADYAAGLRSIRSHGIAQRIHLHPDDIAAIQPLL